jgi:hypothetical protein
MGRGRAGGCRLGGALLGLPQLDDRHGCLDADPWVHQVLMGKVFPRQAEVTRITGWTASRRQPGSGADGP